MITPLPAASPSALTTMGAWKKSIAFSTSACVEQTAKLPVGMLCRCMNCLANPLLVSSMAAARVGPKTRKPRSCRASTMPSESGSSGPTMVSAGLLGLGQAHHGGNIFQIHRNAARNLRHAAVAGRANNFCDPLTAFHRPGQRMFAAPGTKDQDFHRSTPSQRARSKPKR